MILQHLSSVLTNTLLLAQAEEDGARGYTISVAVMLLSVLFGLMLALRPAKREERVKLPKKPG